KAEARKQELKECGDKEKYKIYGDLIISNQYALQKGSLFYDLHNYYDNDNIIRIPADPAETPMQNAQRYYKEYRKKQTAQAKLSGFILQAEDESRYLDSVIDSLSRADSSGEISEIKSELTQTGFLKRRNYKNSKSPKALKPKEYISTDGFKISVGRNNLMNDKLTLKTAKKHDLWFHIKDGAGSHVIVANNGFEFTDEVIREAAMLAAYNSKAKNSSNVAVDYTLVKNVKKPNGAKPGMVVYDNYKTEYVTPNEDELERIKRIV
ncbi:MAG: NFACT family protein, partial [Clostridiales bacterium]|nr:NFACT family protein [Clostridiales bacterium]